MSLPSLASIAVPAVLCLISFLSFSSQYLFSRIEPRPLAAGESAKFNSLIACLLICYFRAIRTDPGRVPPGWDQKSSGAGTIPQEALPRPRWCRKCDAYKPPRAHHCKVCKRCIPKMDHHCPWTFNCVSHTTYPHFIRFLFYCVAAMTYLEYFLYIRLAVIWADRRLPQYLGPSVFQLLHLFALVIVNSLTLFALTILFVRSAWSLSVNTFTIEGWEIERHEALLRRARYMGGYLDGPDGIRIKIERQEFPYDIGIWRNLKQGMGTGNILAWFWPFARTLSVESGLSFEVNDFNEPSMSWPPPDPDRMPRPIRSYNEEDAFIYHNQSPAEQVEAFRRRQREDLKRWRGQDVQVRKRRAFADRFDEDANPIFPAEEGAVSTDGEEGWKNSEGERLRDFGVDEDVEFYDQDDIPLAELMKRRGIRP